MESSSMFVELEDFGQTDLTRRIREVLLNADLEGTTVLELIQNADDAGATTVRLCLDRHPAYAQLWIPVAVNNHPITLNLYQLKPEVGVKPLHDELNCAKTISARQ
nr:hypothetical protein CFP56_37893 [Quercus suber]